MAQAMKTFLLAILTWIAPFFIQGIMQVVLPLLMESLAAVINGNPLVIAEAKVKIKMSWKQYVKDAQSLAAGTPSPLDDMFFAYLDKTDMDDAFIEKLFDQAVKLEQQLKQQFFRAAPKGVA